MQLRRIALWVLTVVFTLSLAATAAVPRGYKGISLGMNREQMIPILQKLIPDGEWYESKPGQWEWNCGSGSITAYLDKNGLTDFGLKLVNDQPSSKVTEQLLATFGLPIQWDVFPRDELYMGWADDQTLVTAHQNGFMLTIWIDDISGYKSTPLPAEIRGFKLGMPRKDAVAVAKAILPGLDPQPGKNYVRSNELKDRWVFDAGDSDIVLSFVDDKLAEVMLEPGSLIQSELFADPGKNFGDYLYDGLYGRQVWFDGRTVMTAHSDLVRLVSTELYAKGIQQALDAGPDWDTNQLNVTSNRNGALAKQELAKKTTEQLLKAAVEADLAVVQKDIRKYIGKVVRITAKAWSVEAYESNSQEAYIMNDGRRCAFLQLKGGANGTVPVAVSQLGDAGGARIGGTVTVIGYVIGLAQLKDETGKVRDHISIVSRVVQGK